MKRCLALLIFPALVCTLPAVGQTVAVLPFANHTTNTRLDWIGTSISEAVRDALGESGVLVLNPDAVKEACRRLGIRPGARLTRASVVKIAETLDAERIIDGSFDVTPASAPNTRESLRVTARMVDIAGMKQMPEFGHTAALEDLAEVQNRMGWQALRQLRPDSAATEEEFLKAHPPVRVAAIENYIRGLLASSAEQKLRLFTQAARLDARFARPNLALGRLHWEQEQFRAAADAFAKVRQPDPHYFEATFYLGLCRFYMNDFVGAQAAFEIVSRELPLNEVFNDLGAAMSRRGRPEALENFRKALEGDASDPDYHFNVGYALWKRGSYEDAAKSFRAVLERDPEDGEAKLMLGRCAKKSAVRSRDLSAEPQERVKEEFNESVFRQLKAALEKKPR